MSQSRCCYCKHEKFKAIENRNHEYDMYLVCEKNLDGKPNCEAFEYKEGKSDGCERNY